MATTCSFNYNKIHLFDKDGCELMLSYKHAVVFKFINSEHENESAEYAFVAYGNELINSTLYKIKPGTRYNDGNPVVTAIVTINGTAVPERFQVNVGLDSFVPYESSDGTKYELDIDYDHWTTANKKSFLQSLGIQISGNRIVDNRIPFPSSTFESNLVFEKVSTELIETQTLYALVESNGRYVDVSTYVSEDPNKIYYSEAFIKKYGLFFFIDCREQSDFRIFTVSSDEITWTDRQFINFKNGLDPGPQNGYRVDIGFSGENEGVYEEKIYMCLAELDDGEYTNGAIHIIGKITMKAETEGFDERYKTLFTNFGLPDPIETERVFSDSNDNDDKPDYRKINRHAKKTFLTYSEIFPYAGSYKALFNATKLLGYDDIFFKEWYREIGGEIKDNRGYVAYDITAGSTSKQNSITNKTIEERIHLKKLNWLSMMYRLEEEDNSKPIDIYGFPSVIKKENYYTRDKILKLISLKKWLEKYIIGVNARITDVGGEGIVFERFSMPKYGSYQQVFDYTNEKSIGANSHSRAFVLKDASASIRVNVNTSDELGRIEDYKGKSFYYFAEGKFVEDGEDWIFRELSSSSDDDDNIVYFGRCIELHDNLNTIEFKAKGTLDSIRLGGESMVLNGTCGIIVDEGEMFFDPDDSIENPNISIFNNPPIIEIKSGKIGDVNIEFNESKNVCIINSVETAYRKITLIPPTHTGTFNSYSSLVTLKPAFSNSSIPIHNEQEYGKDVRTYGLVYNRDTKSNDAVLKIIGYECSQTNGGLFTCDISESERLQIRDGRLIFNDADNNRKIILEYSSESGNVVITPKVLQYSESVTMYKYLSSIESEQNWVERFTPNQAYTDFIINYNNEPDGDEHINGAIRSNSSCEIIVKNAGIYDIDAVILDQWNNMFSKKLCEKINVVSSDIDASTYSTSDYSNNEFDFEGKEATNPFTINDPSTFIYKYCPKREISSVNGVDSSTVSIELDYDGIENNSYVRKYGKVMINSQRATLYRVEPSSDQSQKCMTFHIDFGRNRQHYFTNSETDKEHDCKIVLVDNATDYPVLIYDAKFSNMYFNQNENYTEFDILISNEDYVEFKRFLDKRKYDIYVFPNWRNDATSLKEIDPGNVFRVDTSTEECIISEGLVYKMKLLASTDKCGFVSVKFNETEQSGNQKILTCDTEIRCDSEDARFVQISPAVGTFFSTSLKLDGSLSNFKDGSIVLGDDRSREYGYFLDPTLAVGFLDFDSRNGEKMWADINEQSLYTYNCPLRTSDPRIIVKPLLGRAFDEEPTKYTVRWKLFRQYTNAKHELLLECWNRMVAFVLPEEGTYDIDLTVYDENGNKYNKFLDGIITYDKNVNEQ